MPGEFLVVEKGNLVVKVGVKIFLKFHREMFVYFWAAHNYGKYPQSLWNILHANYFTIFKGPLYDSGSIRDGAIWLTAIT